MTFALTAAEPHKWQITIVLPSGFCLRVWALVDGVNDGTVSSIVCTEDKDFPYALSVMPSEDLTAEREHLEDLIAEAAELDEENLNQPPNVYVQDAEQEFEWFWDRTETPWAAIALRAHELAADEEVHED